MEQSHTQIIIILIHRGKIVVYNHVELIYFNLIPSHTLLVGLGSILGEFGQVVVFILTRCMHVIKSNTNDKTMMLPKHIERIQ